MTVSELHAEAVQCLRTGRLQSATEACHALLAVDPRHSDALGILGLVAMQQQNFPAAAEWFARAVEIRPKAARLQYYRGRALAAIGGHEEEAIAVFHEAVRLDANFADAHHELGNMLKRLRRYGEAAASLSIAAKIAPNNAAIQLDWGVAQLERGLVEAAVTHFRRAVELAPHLAEAHTVLGLARLESGDISAAQDAFSAALRLKPGDAAAQNNLARTYRLQARHSEAIAEFRAALASAPEPAVHSNLCYTLNFVAGMAPDEIWREHEAWGRRWGDATVVESAANRTSSAADLEGASPSAPRTSERDGNPPVENPVLTSRATKNDDVAGVARAGDPGDRGVTEAGDKRTRLRIGFVSPDLVNHAVAYFFEPLLAARDRVSWEAICYSDAPVADATTARLRALADQWRDTAALKGDDLEALIRRDRIDILVDLAGHTAHNRLTVFARKPAPVQVTWLGYPNTTGLRAIDYRMTDGISDPPGQTERWYAEQLLRLPRAFLCYLPPKDAPNINSLPANSADQITFASFSNFAKVSEPCLKTWAQILCAVPKSRLILKSRGLADPGTVARIHAQFETHGIGPARVILDGKLVSVSEHLRQYHGIDIALDPFPYNGTTTTCEALWMGVPVVTLAGETHVARVGASLLTHLGHSEWIAPTPGEYVSRATSLAGDRVKLGEIRQHLRSEMQRSPLCDAKGFAADFTAALEDIWEKYLKTV